MRFVIFGILSPFDFFVNISRSISFVQRKHLVVTQKLILGTPNVFLLHALKLTFGRRRPDRRHHSKWISTHMKYLQFLSAIPQCLLFLNVADKWERQPVSELLYPNASIGQSNASLMVRSFCSHFKLSEVAMRELYSMLHCFLPPENNLRSAFPAVNSSKKRLAELTAAAFETTNVRVYVLKLSNPFKQ